MITLTNHLSLPVDSILRILSWPGITGYHWVLANIGRFEKKKFVAVIFAYLKLPVFQVLKGIWSFSVFLVFFAQHITTLVDFPIIDILVPPLKALSFLCSTFDHVTYWTWKYHVDPKSSYKVMFFQIHLHLPYLIWTYLIFINIVSITQVCFFEIGFWFR